MSINMSDVSTLYKDSQYSAQASKLMSSYGALKILSETGKAHGRQKRDTLSISAEARQFSKESIVALVDRYACSNTTTVDNFKFYFAHYNDARAILDALNFSEEGAGFVQTSVAEGFGVFDFQWHGTQQLIPMYAVPKMNANSFPCLQAHGNVLKLENKSYYSVAGDSGKPYVMGVNNGSIQRPFTESFIREAYGTNRGVYSYSKAKINLAEILTDLAKGRGHNGYIKEELRTVGIVEGHFTVEAGAGKHHYALCEDGRIEEVDYWIKFLNEVNWTKDGVYQENDVFIVYGKEYKIGSDGHIHVSADDDFTDTKIVYPPRRKPL